MVDILVRNVDDATAAQLKKKAKAAGKSVNDVAREALKAAVKPSREELWAEADRLRAKIGKVSGDSTQMIREDRDSR
jgi:plasmid stability protein